MVEPAAECEQAEGATRQGGHEGVGRPARDMRLGAIERLRRAALQHVGKHRHMRAFALAGRSRATLRGLDRGCDFGPPHVYGCVQGAQGVREREVRRGGKRLVDCRADAGPGVQVGVDRALVGLRRSGGFTTQAETEGIVHRHCSAHQRTELPWHEPVLLMAVELRVRIDELSAIVRASWVVRSGTRCPDRDLQRRQRPAASRYIQPR